ncbi:MAG: hypothetical protein RLZZ387_1728 [Chloroflexota bacterium]
MWTVAQYQPTALFSLKPATATSSGGKTLICPTPFALKMALLDAALRTRGEMAVRPLWKDIRDLRIRLQLPERLSVIHTFTKIVRPKKNGPSDDEGVGVPMPLGRTIAYREYVSFGGPIGLAFQMASGELLPQPLADLFVHITYLGKRGGFMQLLAPPGPQEADESQGWVALTADQRSFMLGGTLQMLDDCGPKMTFEQADIYSGKRLTAGKDRIFRHVVLPYRLARSSRGFSLYERIS